MPRRPFAVLPDWLFLPKKNIEPNLLILANFKPFEIRVYTDEFEEQTNEDGASATDTPQTGFQIMFMQVRC